jgi:hypothetical protein
MSESQQNGQSSQSPPPSEIVVDDSATLPTYINFCRATATPEEVILDFGLNPQPFAQGKQEIKASQRIVMNFFTAKRLLSALTQTVQRHEATFGVIEIDINRRVSVQRPAFAPAVPSIQLDAPETIKIQR